MITRQTLIDELELDLKRFPRGCPWWGYRPVQVKHLKAAIKILQEEQES